MAHRILETPEHVTEFTRLLGSLKLPLTVEWVQGRDRTSQQNRLQWLWASEAAHQYGDRAAADIQAEWKLGFGVPVLRESSAEFRAVYDSILKPLAYEDKIKAMRHLDISISSAMKVKQMIRYLDSIQRECIENGIHLTEPSPDLAKYQKRYR